MLYIAVCQMCHLSMESKDVNLIKEKIADHAERSHGLAFPLFVSGIPLNEFEEIATILRIKNPKDILMIKESTKSPRFWNAFRNPPKS